MHTRWSQCAAGLSTADLGSRRREPIEGAFDQVLGGDMAVLKWLVHTAADII